MGIIPIEIFIKVDKAVLIGILGGVDIIKRVERMRHLPPIRHAVIICIAVGRVQIHLEFKQVSQSVSVEIPQTGLRKIEKILTFPIVK